MTLRIRLALIAALAALAAFFAFVTPNANATTLGPQTPNHYAANGNFDANGNYLPGSLGFNLADISSASALSWIPTGVKGLSYIGTCNGADTTFQNTINGYVANAAKYGNLYGFYLVDEPDPTGQWKTQCTAANLKAEADYVHATIPGAKAFIVMMNLSSSKTPWFGSYYTPANTDLDSVGIDPYPCRSELNGCNYNMINQFVAAAQTSGWPVAQIVPVYQTFGGGTWVDDGGGSYLLPTADQETTILNTWASLVPTPPFDYAYSYGVQNSDTALSNAPSTLQSVMQQHNTSGGAAPLAATTSSSSSPTSSPSPSRTKHHHTAALACR